jgi:hypothetical protein
MKAAFSMVYWSTSKSSLSRNILPLMQPIGEYPEPTITALVQSYIGRSRRQEEPNFRERV